MPPKVKFTKDEIIQAALNVARVKGASSVSTRDIAAELQVSTRPIFTYFDTMEEVRAEIRKAAEVVYERYVQRGLAEPIPFLGVGMEYIRFAREEPQLYRLLFLTPAADENSGVGATMRQSVALLRPSLQAFYHLDEAAAERYAFDMLLVAHGLASLIVSGACSYTDEQIRRIFTHYSLALCKAYKEVPGFTDDTYDREAVFGALVPHGKA